MEDDGAGRCWGPALPHWGLRFLRETERVRLRHCARFRTLGELYMGQGAQCTDCDYRMGRRLQQMLEDVRERHDHLTSWVRPDIKKALYIHWETDEGFRHWHLTNRANMALARSSKYTGGSVTFTKTKARLSKSLDHDATLVENFKYTYTLKENKERFTDQQSVDHYESYTQRLETSTHGEDASGSTASVVDSDAVWRETSSAPYKNCVYGLGSFFASSLRTSTLRSSSATTTIRAVNPKKGIDLRLQVQELIRSLHEQAHKLNETRERYQKIFTWVTNTNELRLEWRERLQRMEQQMTIRASSSIAAGGTVLLMAAVLLVGHRHHCLFHCLSRTRE
ncbi:hypothetical protein Ahy_A07g033528 [Arachis hypogaea]|uniref:Uncharacterized protein n=1 Tax=Arachis hypogaea TaxID=3818 RepID=A0A445C9S9_ARAHY|nr:hypothetical protein Ahy_A07g033528 [Arachis hypogaea]